MEYLLISGSVAQMSDGLGNVCPFSEALPTSTINRINGCAKAQSRTLTELSGHSRLTHLQDGSFLRFPGYKRHNISFFFLCWKKK